MIALKGKKLNGEKKEKKEKEWIRLLPAIKLKPGRVCCSVSLGRIPNRSVNVRHHYKRPVCPGTFVPRFLRLPITVFMMPRILLSFGSFVTKRWL